MSTGDTKKQVSLAQAQSGKALAAANSLVIETKAEYEQASELLGKIKTAVKWVQNEANKMLIPLKEALKVEKERWDPVIKEAEQAEGVVKTKMLAYINKVEQEARAKEAKIQKDLEAGRIKPETAMKKAEAVETVQARTVSDTGGAQVVKVRKVRIFDPLLVPDEYWMLDEVRIRKNALAGVVIPGVEVTTENSISGLSK